MNDFYTDIDGAKIRMVRTLDFGNRPTLVFLHESFGCIDHWRDFPRKLGETAGCNILAYDRQGYGGSSPFTENKRGNDYLEKEAGVLCRMVRDLQIETPVLFGHSDGGSIALIAAARYPDIFKAVITEGAHVFVEEITLEGIRSAVKAYGETDLKSKLEKYHREKTDRVFGMWHETWLSEEFRSWNIENLLPGISCPVLVIQGTQDEYGSIRQVESITKKVSGYSERFMPECGHTPHRQSPQEVMECCKKFITDLP